MGSTEQYSPLLALLVFSCMQLLGQHHLCQGAPTFNCREDERKALLQFKDGVQDTSGMLSSWVGMNCCTWLGVTWSNRTGHVIQLDLHDSSLLIGSVPPELGNLSSLRYLDLSGIPWGLEIEDDSWLSRLSSLHYLDLSNMKVKNFSRMLPLLSELHMSSCLLSDNLPLHVNFTSLKILVLSSNNFNTMLPAWLFEISSLKYLDLSWNSFKGHAPSAMANLTSLEFLDLSHNQLLEGVSLSTAVSKLANVTTLHLSDMNLKGELQRWFNGDHRKLEYLDLSNNQLNGTITERSFGQLSSLVVLDLRENSLNGVLTVHFKNLTRLETLDLSHNSLEIRIRSGWTLPHLNELSLDDCIVGQAFPAWLQNIENISEISMPNVKISDVIPYWFWNFSLNISYIDLSNNMIRGKLPASLQHLNHLEFLDLSNTWLEAPFPELPENLQELKLSNTSLNGGIPSSICKLTELRDLDLSGNHFSGEIPNCFDSKVQLTSVDLSNNELSGTVPSSICSPRLGFLQMGRNNLSGGFPLALRNCTFMWLIDLGNNKFSSSIPAWLGSMTYLMVLRLQSNMFAGQIPRELSNLSSLRMIDLSHNMLSGPLPQSFANLSAMKHSNSDDSSFSTRVSIDVWTKGRHQEYIISSDNLLTSIDLSDNNLSGWIPEALTALDGLQNLNLSNNHLTGTIPTSIKGLRYLESLDLSFNNITGEIPEAMADLNFLSFMNFSFNQLSGRIPTGGQFDSHPDASIYIGNADLCGFPLNISCQSNVTNQPSQNTNNGKQAEEHENVWFFVSVSLGFVSGFWVLVGSLLLKTEWRIWYYRYIDHAYDKFYVFVAINLVNIWHK